jgi:hypothetical protein
MIDDQADFEFNIRYDPHKTSETAIQEELREQLVATGRSVVAPPLSRSPSLLVSITVIQGKNLTLCSSSFRHITSSSST